MSLIRTQGVRASNSATSPRAGALAAARAEFDAEVTDLNTATLGLPPRRSWLALQDALTDWRAGTADPVAYDAPLAAAPRARGAAAARLSMTRPGSVAAQRRDRQLLGAGRIVELGDEGVGPGDQSRHVYVVRRRRRIVGDPVASAPQQGGRAGVVAAQGMRQRDGELGQALPQFAFGLGRRFPAAFENLVRVEGHAVVEQALGFVERGLRRQRQAVGHARDAGRATGQRTSEAVARAGVERPAAGITLALGRLGHPSSVCRVGRSGSFQAWAAPGCRVLAAAGETCQGGDMCRNIRVLNNFEPPATSEEVQAAALQYVRKVSGSAKPSAANEAAFGEAVAEIAHVTQHLLDGLVTTAPARDRAVEAAKARDRNEKRFASA